MIAEFLRWLFKRDQVDEHAQDFLRSPSGVLPCRPPPPPLPPQRRRTFDSQPNPAVIVHDDSEVTSIKLFAMNYSNSGTWDVTSPRVEDGGGTFGGAGASGTWDDTSTTRSESSPDYSSCSDSSSSSDSGCSSSGGD